MIPNEDATWPELLREPAKGDHFVQLYSDEAFLCEAVAEYAGTGLRRGEGVLIIATRAHRADFLRGLEARGHPIRAAMKRGQLVLLDADETLARFTAGGMPDWQSFRALIGGAIASVRLECPAVRAFGEMVDVLW